MRETKIADRLADFHTLERTLGNRTLKQNNIALDDLLWNIINETVTWYNQSNNASHSFNRRTISREDYLMLLDKIHKVYKRIN